MIGKKIQELRKELGFTADKMAEQLEISPFTYGSYERSTAKPPYILVYNLIKKFNVNPYWLINNIGPIFSPSQNTYELRENPRQASFKDIGKKFNKARIHADMTSHEFCMLIDMNERRYADICVGKVKPTIDECVRLSNVINITLDNLIFDEY